MQTYMAVIWWYAFTCSFEDVLQRGMYAHPDRTRAPANINMCWRLVTGIIWTQQCVDGLRILQQEVLHIFLSGATP